MTAAEFVGNLAGLVIVSVVIGVVVALVGVAVLGVLVQRWRTRAEARLDDVQSRVLQMAVELSDQTRAEGQDARVRLIRAAHAAMSEQESRGRQP